MDHYSGIHSFTAQVIQPIRNIFVQVSIFNTLQALCLLHVFVCLLSALEIIKNLKT